MAKPVPMRSGLKIVSDAHIGRHSHAVLRMPTEADPRMRSAPLLLRFVVAAFPAGPIVHHHDLDAALTAPRSLFAFAALGNGMVAIH